MKQLIKLTNSQTKLINNISDWYTNNKSLAYVISGQAGTGKSFITKYIIENIFKNKRVCVSAPTHKAAAVIEQFSGLKGFTIHSLHGLRPNFNIIDFNVDKIKFEALGLNKFMKYNIIIIDESSMIGGDLFKLNNIRSLQYNTKIVYIGDKLQLSPISGSNIELSPVFNNKYGTELTDIVRQSASNSLMILFKLLRIDIVNNSSKFIDYINNSNNSNNIKNGIGFSIIPSIKMRDNIILAFKSDEFKNDISSYKVCAYTNNRINIWNKFIRHSIIDNKDIIYKGDILMGYKTIVDEYLSPIIINGNDYIVINSYSKLSDFKFKIFVTTIKDLTSGFIHEINIVDHTDISFKLYYNKLYILYHNAVYGDLIHKGELWRMYYNFKDLYITMFNFNLTDKNGRKLSTIAKELDYGYAVTVHKLQGSTIKNLFVDCLDIIFYKGNKRMPRYNYESRPNVIEIRNRMLYTALSRVSNKAVIMY